MRPFGNSVFGYKESAKMYMLRKAEKCKNIDEGKCKEKKN